MFNVMRGDGTGVSMGKTGSVVVIVAAVALALLLILSPFVSRLGGDLSALNSVLKFLQEVTKIAMFVGAGMGLLGTRNAVDRNMLEQ